MATQQQNVPLTDQEAPSLGFQPARFIGQKSLSEIQQQNQGIAELLNNYTPGAITQKNLNRNTQQLGKKTSGNQSVGGSANQFGQFTVYDSSGNIIATIDNTGISIAGGNFSVKSSSAKPVIDSTGLVSVTSFPVFLTSSAGPQSTTSATYQPITGSSIVVAPQRTVSVVINVSTLASNAAITTTNDTVLVGLFIDGVIVTNTEVPGALVTGGTVARNSGGGFTYITQLLAGTRTITARFASLNGGTASVSATNLSITILGT